MVSYIYCKLRCKTRFSLITILVQHLFDDIAKINDCTKRKFIIVYCRVLSLSDCKYSLSPLSQT